MAPYQTALRSLLHLFSSRSTSFDSRSATTDRLKAPKKGAASMGTQPLRHFLCKPVHRQFTMSEYGRLHRQYSSASSVAHSTTSLQSYRTSSQPPVNLATVLTCNACVKPLTTNLFVVTCDCVFCEGTYCGAFYSFLVVDFFANDARSTQVRSTCSRWAMV